MVFVLNGIGCNQVVKPPDNNEDDPKSVPFDILMEVPGPGKHIVECRFNAKNIDVSDCVSNDDMSDVELIIRNYEDFNKYIICLPDKEEINFEEHFLLAGVSKGHHQCLYIKEQRVYIEIDTLYYSIEIREADCFVPTRAQYIVKVPIEYFINPIQFKVFWGDRK